MITGTPNFYEEIDHCYSDWSHIDKMARLGWLTREKIRLNGLITLMASYIRTKRGHLNDSEKTYAKKLLDMIQMVDDEGAKVVNDLRTEAFTEIICFMSKV